MRTSLRLAFLLPALIALAGCGGGTGHFAATDGGPGHPGDDGSPGDDIAPGDDIVGDDELPPPPFDDGGIDPRCASGSPVGTGFACGGPGLMCPLGTITDCAGNMMTLNCFCDGKQWKCDALPDVEICPTPVACPDPRTLYPGSVCNVPIGQSCYSQAIPPPSCGGGGDPPPPMGGTCTCQPNGWLCPTMPTTCPAPASCPDPYSVYPYAYCNSYGQTCPGNPTNCGGQIYYDALQCMGNGWVSVATTSCEIVYDGGPAGEDASPALACDSCAF